MVVRRGSRSSAPPFLFRRDFSLFPFGSGRSTCLTLFRRRSSNLPSLKGTCWFGRIIETFLVLLVCSEARSSCWTDCSVCLFPFVPVVKELDFNVVKVMWFLVFVFSGLGWSALFWCWFAPKVGR